MQQQALLPKLNEAHRALQACTTDFERLWIRDTARAVQAAAAVLGRRDIQVMAAELVGDAERAIAQANPAQLRKRDRVAGIGVTPGHGNSGYVGELSRGRAGRRPRLRGVGAYSWRPDLESDRTQSGGLHLVSVPKNDPLRDRARSRYDPFLAAARLASPGR